MASVTLPEEIPGTVFEHLAATDRSALLRVSLASRQLRRIAIPLVFKEVFVSGELLCGPCPILDYAEYTKKITLRDLSTVAYTPISVRERATNFGGLLRECVNLETLELGVDGKKFFCKDNLLRLALRNSKDLPRLHTFINYTQCDVIRLLPTLGRVAHLYLFGPNHPHLDISEPATAVWPRRTFPNVQHLFLRNISNDSEYSAYFNALQTSQIFYGDLDPIFPAFYDLNTRALPPQTGILKIGGGGTIDFSVHYNHQCKAPRFPTFHLVLCFPPLLADFNSEKKRESAIATEKTIDHARQMIQGFESPSVKCTFVFERFQYCGRIREFTFVLKTKPDASNSSFTLALDDLETEKIPEMLGAKKMTEIDKVELIESVEKVKCCLQSGEIAGDEVVALAGCLILEREW